MATHPPRFGATFDENVGAVRASAGARAAIGRFNRGPEIAAGDSGSHFPVRFSSETTRLESCLAPHLARNPRSLPARYLTKSRLVEIINRLCLVCLIRSPATKWLYPLLKNRLQPLKMWRNSTVGTRGSASATETSNGIHHPLPSVERVAKGRVGTASL